MGIEPKLEINLNGLKLKNPVLSASGCFAYGGEAAEIYDLSLLGGVITKSLTYLPREGHPPPKVVEISAGMLNAIGLSNVGINRFLTDKLPFLAKQETACIVSIAGSNINEYVKLAEVLNEQSDVDSIEVNISCPNVDEGGMEFGAFAKPAGKVINEVKKVFKRPVIAKLSPNVTSIVEIAKAVEDNGADVISLINTLVGTAIDINGRKFKLSNTFGGVSGPAIKPIALSMVYKVASNVKIPLIGLGGIATASDAIEFILAGASAVQVGTACFFDPKAPLKIIEGIRNYLIEQGEDNLKDIVGTVRRR